MPSAKKMRLDAAMVEMGLQATRSRAQALIMAGHVSVNGTTVRKNGLLVTPTDEIRIQDKDHGFVSRGGLKLEAALRAFAISPAQRVCLDVGASTGGFTDCLLQAGARRVYAVDVGYGQFAWKLRQDPRVVVIERTNIRHMPPNRLPEAMDLATIDVSFISLKIVVPVVLKFMAPRWPNLGADQTPVRSRSGMCRQRWCCQGRGAAPCGG